MLIESFLEMSQDIYLADTVDLINMSCISSFLPRDSMLSAVYAVVVCLSVCVCVCVCVTLWYCIKTSKRRITQITLHDNSVTLVF